MIDFHKLLENSKERFSNAANQHSEELSKRRERPHSWITVVNPTNRRMLLQACDHCGVVKSENTVVKQCSAEPGAHLISESLSSEMRVVA